eukprot:m.483005 g.483005  ORF g.483005 m.483005 type:complete len:696 (+) comp22741_c0_seq1:136-2223(+)
MAAVEEQPFEKEALWLEEVLGEKPIEWVRGRNEHVLGALGTPTEHPVHDRLLSILESKDKIPTVSKIGEFLYNFWQDGSHVRGLWRRTSLEEFRKPAPQWETVIDLDELGKAEDKTWVWHGYSLLQPDRDLALIHLSPGGSDASVIREFNLSKLAFVSESEQGFVLPVAKSRVSWLDRNTLLVGTDFGEGSLTDSGYPRVSKQWKRGTPLAEAELVYEGEKEDVAASSSFEWQPGYEYTWRHRRVTFYTSKKQVKFGKDGEWTELQVPDDVELSAFKDQLLLWLRTPWTVGGKEYPAGTLLAVPTTEFLKNGAATEPTPLFVQTPEAALETYCCVKEYLILTILHNVQNVLEFWKYTPGSSWEKTSRNASKGYQTRRVRPFDRHTSNAFFLTAQGYTEPSSLSLHADAGSWETTEPEKLKQLPSFFNADDLVVEQHSTKSKDGTDVFYFEIKKKDCPMDGTTPTLLYGYGGFEISMVPGYAATIGVSWLEKGGCYVEANIRGGGEFGPPWHQAALKEKRHTAYEDFVAVGEDLIARKVTTKEGLGCRGGSNGGLLTGNMLTMRPDLWGAIVCQVPLLDMRRFNKLLAGASWMAEYGDPDTDDWANFLHKYSPYQNLKESVAYPPILFTTSTKDDRVHPGHARKMVHRMLELKAENVYYYENIEGGHAGAADNKQRAFMTTLMFQFLYKTLGLKGD